MFRPDIDLNPNRDLLSHNFQTPGIIPSLYVFHSPHQNGVYIIIVDSQDKTRVTVYFTLVPVSVCQLVEIKTRLIYASIYQIVLLSLDSLGKFIKLFWILFVKSLLMDTIGERATAISYIKVELLDSPKRTSYLRKIIARAIDRSHWRVGGPFHTLGSGGISERRRSSCSSFASGNCLNQWVPRSSNFGKIIRDQWLTFLKQTFGCL